MNNENWNPTDTPQSPTQCGITDKSGESLFGMQVMNYDSYLSQDTPPNPKMLIKVRLWRWPTGSEEVKTIDVSWLFDKTHEELKNALANADEWLKMRQKRIAMSHLHDVWAQDLEDGTCEQYAIGVGATTLIRENEYNAELESQT